jgi:hypothetical protein
MNRLNPLKEFTLLITPPRSRLRAFLIALLPLTLLAPHAFAGTVNITSPRPGSTVSGAVFVSASATESIPFHLEIWDTGHKLGDFFSNVVNTAGSQAQGAHALTILAVSNRGAVLDRSSVSYTVQPTTSPAVNPQAPENVVISSPVPGSSNAGAVTIAASANESVPFHLEIWDNGGKLGDFFSNSVTSTPALPQGTHVTTVLAVANTGSVLSKSSVSYSIAASSPSGPVQITSPTPGATSTSAVTIAATANLGSSVHLDIFDNGTKLGSVASNSVNGVYVLPNGSHVLTVQAIDPNGSVSSTSSVNYTVAESCSNSRFAQCNLDQLPVDNVQNNCNPGPELLWVANGCGGGVQGVNPTNPLTTVVQTITEGGAVPDQGNLTLNGHSLRFMEVQGTNPSNVLFRGQSPATTPAGAIDSHWTLDEYVYLPDPAAHQAFEMDAQYTAGGIWTKFYTECAFNMNSGTGFWGVFDSATGGWIFLNGKAQNGQTPPVVPCSRSQFSQPWTASGNPSFSGWHHIAWTFLREPDGTVTYQTLTFDGTTTAVNFRPDSATGGSVSDSGNFSALIQLDGVVNTNRQHDVVDAYLSEINLTHTP